MLVIIWVLYSFLHYYLKAISDSWFNAVLFLTACGLVNYSYKNFNERYLIFNANTLVYGSENLTIWHIPLNKICRIEKVAVKCQRYSLNSCAEKIVIYTTNNDSFELHDIFNKADFFEIESALKKVVANQARL